MLYLLFKWLTSLQKLWSCFVSHVTRFESPHWPPVTCKPELHHAPCSQQKIPDSSGISAILGFWHQWLSIQIDTKRNHDTMINPCICQTQRKHFADVAVVMVDEIDHSPSSWTHKYSELHYCMINGDSAATVRCADDSSAAPIYYLLVRSSNDSFLLFLSRYLSSSSWMNLFNFLKLWKSLFHVP